MTDNNAYFMSVQDNLFKNTVGNFKSDTLDG